MAIARRGSPSAPLPSSLSPFPLLLSLLALCQYSRSQSDLSYCEETSWRGATFPRTRACESVLVDCPDKENIEGFLRRQCECGEEKDGDSVRRYVRWETIPDSNNCTHRWVKEMTEGIRRGRQAEEVSTETASHLRDTVESQLYGGDIGGSVEISRLLLDLARNQFDLLDDRNNRQKRARNFTQSLGDCGDSLLSGKAVPVWELLPADTKIQRAAALMASLENSAILLGDYSFLERQRLGFDNWEMEVEVRRSVPTPSPSPSLFASAAIAPSSMDDSAASAVASPPIVSYRAPALPPPASADAPPPSDSSSSRTEFSFNIKKSPIISLPSTTILSSSSASSSLFAPADDVAFSPFGSQRMAAPSPPMAAPQPQNIRLGSFVFSSLGTIMSNSTTRVNSQIIGASVNDATRSVQLPDTDPAILTFFHLFTSGVSNARCVYWDTFTNEWSTSGCRLLTTNSTTSICECNHLTSFAILMDITGKLSDVETAALDVVTVVGCAVSVVCLLMAFLVFTCFRSLRGLRSTIHANLCLTLAVAELVFVLGVNRTKNTVACSVTALLLHLLFLSAFCWMLAEGVQLYMMLVQVFEPSSTHVVLFYLFCYGAPAVVVAISAGIDWSYYGTPAYCWINTETRTIWSFAAPVAVVVAINIVFLLIALRVVLSISSRDRSRAERLRGWLKGSATLLCLLGITWIFGFLTAVHGASLVFAWIFTLLNCTQGIFIFVLHVLLNEKARHAVIRWLQGGGICCCSSPDSAANFNSKEFLTSRQRFLNMVRGQSSDTALEEKKKKTRKGEEGSGPSTASTDSKDKGPLTPTSKTSAWLSQIPSQDVSEPVDDPIIREPSVPSMAEEPSTLLCPPPTRVYLAPPSPLPECPLEEEEEFVPPLARSCRSLDLRSSHDGRAPVRRKKFPLGATEDERGPGGPPQLTEEHIYRF